MEYFWKIGELVPPQWPPWQQQSHQPNCAAWRLTLQF